MKRTLLAILAMALLSVAYAQPWAVLLPKEIQPTFYDYQKAFNDYWAPYDVVDGKYINDDGQLVRAAGWKQFKRWEYHWSSRVNLNTGAFPDVNTAGIYRQEYDRMDQEALSRNASSSGIWTPMGPSSSPGGYAGLGRINCVAFGLYDPYIIYAGTPAGGLWKSFDNGLTWFALAQELSSLGVSNIVVVEEDGVETLYISTGDKDAKVTWSIGILKSTDGGNTFVTTGFTVPTSDQITIWDLKADPMDHSRIFASTSLGVYLTTDAGATWSMVSNYLLQNIVFKPFDSQVIYGAGEFGLVVRSTDGGQNWGRVLEVTGARFTKIAVTEDDPDRLYVVMGNAQSGLYGIYRSDDSGDNFAMIYNEKNLLGWVCDGSDQGGQAFYDLVITADPLDADVVFLGGVNVWKSVDGGYDWQINCNWSQSCQGTASIVHADVHAITYHPLTHALYNGNDGGLYVSLNNGINWNYISEGLEISQLYSVSNSATRQDLVLTGLQDNGAKMRQNGQWFDVSGGDAMIVHILPSNDSIQTAALPNGEVMGTVDMWNNMGSVTESIGLKGAWVTPYQPDPIIDTLFYVAYNNLYTSDNSGVSWDVLSNFNVGNLTTLSVSPADNQTILTGNDTILYLTRDRGATWTDITAGLPESSVVIKSVQTSHRDPLRYWVTLGGYSDTNVMETTDGGQTWSNISSGLPMLPANFLVENVAQTTRNELYLATDVGIYVKLDDNPWLPYFMGLPNVMVAHLDIFYDGQDPDNNRLRAATYGRGLWESPLFDGSLDMAEQFDQTCTIYPNPASDWLQIDLHGESRYQVRLIDMNGRVLMQTDATEHLTIPVERYPTGVYNLTLISDTGTRLSRNIIVKH
ncbi:MAG: T9SS type A sorting domain-containing protein [Bacteroidales bacterium]|nr:T9SS type A sorting domain-containing protein [Bacteroidales bacterium]